MAVSIFHTLEEKQREDILKLIAACNEYDGLKRQPCLKEEDNYDRELNSYFCYYNENTLLSVLILYQPFKEEAEISAYTLPSYRRQGYFKALFQTAQKELGKYGIRQAAFVAEYQSEAGKACALALGAKLIRSDYLLACQLGQQKKWEERQDQEKLLVTDLTSKNLKDGINAFEQIFGWEKEQIEDMLKESLDSLNCRTYLAYIKGRIAGILSVQSGETAASVFGFGILGKYRGKGCGKYFLSYILDVLEQEGKEKVILQVESESREAFMLYKKAGFTIMEEYDYYYKNII